MLHPIRLLVTGALAGILVVSARIHAQSPSQTPPTPAAAQKRLRASDVDTMSVADPGRRIAYGRDSLQFGDLRLPPGRGPFPVAVVVHGGCWYSPYASLRNTAPLAAALTERGIATWNVEYRRYDHPGGGWPGTFDDVAAALHHVRALAREFPLDTTRVAAAGHSAGAQLSLWLASRGKTRPESVAVGVPPLTLAGVVSIGGITDLREFYARQRATCGNPAVESLLGGVPDSMPARVREVSPMERVPIGVPSVHIAGSADRIAPRSSLDAYAAAARARGDSVEVQTIPADGHFEAIAPTRAAGRAVIEAVLRLLTLPAAAPRAPRREPAS